MVSFSLIFCAVLRFTSSLGDQEVCFVRDFVLVAQDVTNRLTFVRYSSRVFGRFKNGAVFNRFILSVVFERLEGQGVRLVASMSPGYFRRLVVRYFLFIFDWWSTYVFRTFNDRFVHFFDACFYCVYVFGDFFAVSGCRGGRRGR